LPVIDAGPSGLVGFVEGLNARVCAALDQHLVPVPDIFANGGWREAADEGMTMLEQKDRRDAI
jgi:hypothetical protein